MTGSCCKASFGFYKVNFGSGLPSRIELINEDQMRQLVREKLKIMVEQTV